MLTKPKILVILGPTASGKSDLAVKLARKFNGEVISADSRQVYSGLDLGSGKITKKEMMGVPHHLLNIANPKRTFTVSQYKKLADKAITDLFKRGKLPIICGGTGFYIQAIVDNLVLPEVKPNLKLRRGLEKKSADELFVILKNLDPKRAKNIDRHNPRRLVRAIEIATALGAVPKLKPSEPKYDFIQIGITVNMDKLKTKIAKRLEKRLRAGMIAEVKKLHAGSLSWQRLESFGLEYRFIAQFLQGKISRAEMKEKIVSESLAYAKRQMTWFKRDGRVKWVKNKKEVEKLVSFLR